MSSTAPVVCNAGPLINLAKLNLLHVLSKLYGRVRFSRSVYDEAVIEGMRQGYEDANTLFAFLQQMNWLPDEVDLDTSSKDPREALLDRGERDTLRLATLLGSYLILMDETAGRVAAKARGFQVRGSLGILIEAFRQGLIGHDQLRLSLSEMARRQDIWVNPQLVERLLGAVLREEGEADRA
jgi:uncharacterized protein